MKKVKKEIYRQGDVILIRVDCLPKAAMLDESRINGERVEIEYGEVTGHCHALPAQAASRYVVGSNGKEYIKVHQPTAMVHEEHADLVLPAGVYEGRRCQEYTPAGAVRVVD